MMTDKLSKATTGSFLNAYNEQKKLMQLLLSTGSTTKKYLNAPNKNQYKKKIKQKRRKSK